MVMYTLCNKRSISSHFFFYLQLRFFNEEYNDHIYVNWNKKWLYNYIHVYKVSSHPKDFVSFLVPTGLSLNWSS